MCFHLPTQLYQNVISLTKVTTHSPISGAFTCTHLKRKCLHASGVRTGTARSASELTRSTLDRHRNPPNSELGSPEEHPNSEVANEILSWNKRQSLVPEEINELCFVDLNHRNDVLESLKRNVKVSFDGQRFAFKSKHDLKNKDKLLVLVRKFPEGVPMGDLKDSYAGIQADVQDLKATGKAWVLMNSDSQDDIVYPNDPEIEIKVDEDLKQLLRGIDTPREFMDVETELQKAGMKPVTNSAR